MHGKNAGRPPSPELPTSRYYDPEFAARVAAKLADPASLRNHDAILARLSALTEILTERLDTGSIDSIAAYLPVMEQLSKTISRDSEIAYRDSLTGKDLSRLLDAVRDTIIAIVPSDLLPAAMAELQRRLGVTAALPAPNVTVTVIDGE